MEPTLIFNEDFHALVQKTPLKKKKKLILSLEELGEGAAGTAYVATVKKTKQEFVVKELDRYADNSVNEYKALSLLKGKMINNELPHYYPFMYFSFSEDSFKYIVMEKMDYSLDQFMCDYNFSYDWYKNTFIQIATAVKCLEEIEFNHGDLWEENIMLNWVDPNEEMSIDRKFTIKLIDFDCAYKNDSSVNKPGLGGCDSYRDRFYLGFDLNRLISSMLYTHRKYLLLKRNNKKSRIKKLKLDISTEDLPDNDEDREYDEVNTVIPQEFLDFMKSIKIISDNKLSDNKNTAATTILAKLKE